MCDEDIFEVNYKSAWGWEVESTSQFKKDNKTKLQKQTWKKQKKMKGSSR